LFNVLFNYFAFDISQHPMEKRKITHKYRFFFVVVEILFNYYSCLVTWS
jgi:hypothetical protein